MDVLNQICEYSGCNRKATNAGLCDKHYDYNKEKKEEKFLYRLGEYQERFNDMFIDPQIKGLRQEIAVLRMTLEAIFNKIPDTANGFLLVVPHIREITGQIERTVATCHKIELTNNQMLDKNRITQIVDEFVSIIDRYVDNPEIKGKIANELLDSVSRNTNAIGNESI